MKPIDMNEATRLTRLGRLNEAMAVLRGEAPPIPQTPQTPSAAPSGDFIEMVQTGAGWSMAGDMAARPHKTKVGGLADLVNLRKGFKPAGSRPAAPAALRDGAKFDAAIFSTAAGSRSYKLYVPASYTGQPAPLIVMLHGCTQSPDDFAAGTQMNALAEAHGFLVAYPQQNQTANMNLCWNWFNSSEQQRDGAEPSIIAGITRQIMADYSVDPARVFVAGLSAGGAMAAILGATYPELYAAIGVHSGLPVGAAHDMPSAFAAMTQATKPSGRAGTALIPAIVFHGDADRTVNATNGEYVVAQSKGSAPLTQTISQTAAGTKTVYSDSARGPVIEHWQLHGAGHAWSGGSAAGSYTDPRGPDASAEMVRFFLSLRT